MFFVLPSEKVFNGMSLADRFDRMCCIKKEKKYVYFGNKGMFH